MKKNQNEKNTIDGATTKYRTFPTPVMPATTKLKDSAEAHVTFFALLGAKTMWNF